MDGWWHIPDAMMWAMLKTAPKTEQHQQNSMFLKQHILTKKQHGLKVS